MRRLLVLVIPALLMSAAYDDPSSNTPISGKVSGRVQGRLRPLPRASPMMTARTIVVLGLVLLTARGGAVATAAKSTPTPTPTPTPDVGAMYISAIDVLHDNIQTRGHGDAYYKSKQGSPEASAAASTLAADYESLLVSLDAIPFPPNAKDDLSAFKKTVVARQVFWSDVSIADSNYSALTDNNTNDAYNQASILLGHDIGVTLVLQGASPTP
jgi:hypothetical protein